MYIYVYIYIYIIFNIVIKKHEYWEDIRIIVIISDELEQQQSHKIMKQPNSRSGSKQIQEFTQISKSRRPIEQGKSQLWRV